MSKEIINKLILWLRRRRPGTVFRIRDFILTWVSLLGVTPLSARLSIRVFRKNGTVEDKGVVSIHAVTNAFVAELVDTLQSTPLAVFSDYKYHDSGTEDTAEDQTDTGLGTACGDDRTVGTQVEGDTANIYKSVATHTYTGAFAIVEHGLFNAAAVGTLMDRSVFSAINVLAGDKIEFSYSLSCTAGG